MSSSLRPHRCRRLLLAVAKHVYAGLVCVGSWGAPFYIGEYPHRVPSTDGPRHQSATGTSGEDGARRPPPGHPERLVPNLPLSKVERQLWRQLLP
jgi:hypothetical protein